MKIREKYTIITIKLCVQGKEHEISTLEILSMNIRKTILFQTKESSRPRFCFLVIQMALGHFCHEGNFLLLLLLLLATDIQRCTVSECGYLYCQNILYRSGSNETDQQEKDRHQVLLTLHKQQFPRQKETVSLHVMGQKLCLLLLMHSSHGTFYAAIPHQHQMLV